MLGSLRYHARARRACCIVLAAALCMLFLLASCSYQEERSGSGRRVKKQSVIDNTPVDSLLQDKLFAARVSRNMDRG
ncbi:hypothetical protein [Oceanidesulfovibrio marinus]|uniref:hypothetical protein n=1 Tax=Oceanidesulfovibrio marinus TaxID=370038 RepID=UPI0011860FC5|nr:hypothetical protein [Oceanidesulfovibrio marinus]